jgi:hypothetical protein
MQLLYKGLIRMDLFDEKWFTIGLFDFTYSYAVENGAPDFCIMYAITRVTLLDTPAIQCTSTFVRFLYSSINSKLSLKNADISHDSWSTTGTYKYSICFGILSARFFPLIAVITAPMPCSELNRKYFLMWLDCKLLKCLIQRWLRILFFRPRCTEYLPWKFRQSSSFWE